MRTAYLASLLLALPACAGDVLLDAYAAEKSKIADDFKGAAQACATKPAKEQAACHKAAEVSRRNALKAASAERDLGLKCRSSCGLVTEVKAEEKDGEGSLAGTVGGGLVGAVAGRKLAGNSSSSTKNVATVVGAVGGALVGKKIEQKVTKHTVWTVAYTLYDGNTASAQFDQNPGLKAGDRISVKDGKPAKR